MYSTFFIIILLKIFLELKPALGCQIYFAKVSTLMTNNDVFTQSVRVGTWEMVLSTSLTFVFVGLVSPRGIISIFSLKFVQS
jgi:hypothetical protein